VLAGRLVRDGGREWFVLTNMNETAGMELIFIDPREDRGHVYRAPAGAGAWALIPVPENRLAVGTYYDGTFMLFDVPRREWIKTVKFPGEDYLWTFAIGSDGRLYSGTYPGGKLGALDLRTYALEDLGAPAKPNLYLRHTSALPDGRIFCQFGFEQPVTMIFDPAAKQFSRAPESLQSAAHGVSWNGLFLTGNKAYRMPDLAEATPLPFPAPPADGGSWSVDGTLSDDRTLVLRQGSAIYRCRAGEKELTKLIDFPLDNVALYAMNDRGEIFGVRGQDYFVLRPGDRSLTLKPIPGDAAPRPSHFLRVDDQERVWGGPTFGQTLFYHDTKTGKTVNTRTVSDHGGEVYDVAVIDGICYAVAYSGGEIIRFDPNAAWDQIHHVNPKTIARVAPEYIRPAAGVTVGPDGRLYSGWWAQYGTYGGAVAMTDPASGKTEVIPDPLGPQCVSGLAVAGDVLLIGTTTSANGLPKQAGASAQLGVYDLKERKVQYSHSFPGAGSVYSLVYDAMTGRAAFLVDGRLHLFDPAERALTGAQVVVPDKVTSHQITVRDGRVYYGLGETLHALALKTGQSAPIAKLPGKIDQIAVSPRGHLYVTCGVDLYRIDE
jgi:streptogramin lyase